MGKVSGSSKPLSSKQPSTTQLTSQQLPAQKKTGQSSKSGRLFGFLVRVLNAAMRYIGLSKPDATVVQSANERDRKLASYSVSQSQSANMLPVADVQKKILDCESVIQTSAQELASVRRDSTGLCDRLDRELQELNTLLELADDPVAAARKHLDIQVCLQDQLKLMSERFNGLANQQFMQGLIDRQAEQAEECLLNPQHHFRDIPLSAAEQRVRQMTNGLHEDDLREMRETFAKQNKVATPLQTRKDLHRQDFYCWNSEREAFNNVQLRKQYGASRKEQEAAEIAQNIEDGLLGFLEGLSPKQQMQVLSHANQSELNHMHYSVQQYINQRMPLLGGLLQGAGTESSVVRRIDIVRDGDNIEITYKMAYPPRFATELGVIGYAPPSELTMERKVVIGADAKPDYQPMEAQMFLHKGKLLT